MEATKFINHTEQYIFESRAITPGNINILIVPDWSQPEYLLITELEQAIKAVVTHPDSHQITLLIDTNGIHVQEANLLLFAVAMNLLLAENFDITAECEISLVEDTSELERENLKDFIQKIIIIPHQNLQRLALFHIKKIAAYDIKNFINIPLSQLFLHLGNRFFEERKWQVASEQYTKYIQINSGNPETYWRLSQCYRNLNLSDKYFITLKEGIQMQPSDPRLNFPLIIDLQISGRNQEAIISVENACQLLPDDYTFQKLKYLTVPTIYDDQEEITFYRHRYTEGLHKLIKQTSLKTPEEQSNALAGIGR